MWFTKAILILLGLWLMRQVLGLFRGRTGHREGEIRSSPKREKVSPFQDSQVRDAEFEDLDEPQNRPGERR